MPQQTPRSDSRSLAAYSSSTSSPSPAAWEESSQRTEGVSMDWAAQEAASAGQWSGQAAAAPAMVLDPFTYQSVPRSAGNYGYGQGEHFAEGSVAVPTLTFDGQEYFASMSSQPAESGWGPLWDEYLSTASEDMFAGAGMSGLCDTTTNGGY
jgi:hypothetical protein